jgi:hypothetical protein
MSFARMRPSRSNALVRRRVGAFPHTGRLKATLAASVSRARGQQAVGFLPHHAVALAAKLL